MLKSKLPPNHSLNFLSKVNY